MAIAMFVNTYSSQKMDHRFYILLKLFPNAYTMDIPQTNNMAKHGEAFITFYNHQIHNS